VGTTRPVGEHDHISAEKTSVPLKPVVDGGDDEIRHPLVERSFLLL